MATPFSAVIESKDLDEFPENLRRLAKDATNGSPEAQFSLGFCYDTGSDGLPVNTHEAIRWYVLSAQQGHAPAQNNLGVLYSNGHKGRIEKNHREALRWYKAAADNGSPMGQFHAALLLMKGENAKPDTAYQLLKRSAKQNYTMSEAVLGSCYLGGTICEKDYKKGIKYLKKAAMNEDPVALHNLAIVYKRGLGVNVDMERANAYFGLAQESKNSKLFDALAADKTLQDELIFY